jgi:hypothetical protein
MQFTVNIKELLEALDVVSVVPPTASVPGYRFIVREGICSIYSRDGVHVACAKIKVLDSDGDVDLIYTSHILGLKYSKAETVTITGRVEGDRFVTGYTTSEPETKEERASFNPKLLADSDDDYASATSTHTLSAGILRTAISSVKGYIADDTDRGADEQYQTLQIFDSSKPEWEKGDGVMFAANAIRASYFDCADFKGKHLPIRREHLPIVLGFLAKCDGDVALRNGEHMMYLEDSRGRILGFARNMKAHARFSYFSLEKDGYIFKVDKETMVACLMQLKVSLGDAKRDKIFFSYDHDLGVFRISTSESASKISAPPIPINAREFRTPESFTVSVNINHMLDIFQVNANLVELRVAIIAKANKTGALFRTIDLFWCDRSGKLVQDNTQEGAVECKVTRMMPSKD